MSVNSTDIAPLIPPGGRVPPLNSMLKGGARSPGGLGFRYARSAGEPSLLCRSSEHPGEAQAMTSIVSVPLREPRNLCLRQSQ